MSNTHPDQSTASAEKATTSDAAWRAELTRAQYFVLRQHGTERPGTSSLNREKRKETFLCAGWGAGPFASDAKLESGTAWPNFDRPAAGSAVSEHDDHSHLMHWTEVRCARCDSHLGHVFPDGPRHTTGPHSSISGVALKFNPDDG